VSPRWLRRVAEFMEDAPTAKSMALLGPAAFGPPCPDCGGRQIEFMLPRHRAYSDKISMRTNGKPLAECVGMCRCAE
jgi:hypothetical protein